MILLIAPTLALRAGPMVISRPPRGIAKSELRGASRQGMNPLARKRKPLSGLGRDDVRRDATLILPAISPQTVLCPSESFVPAPIGAFCSEPGNSFPGALAHDDSDFAIPLPPPDFPLQSGAIMRYTAGGTRYEDTALKEPVRARTQHRESRAGETGSVVGRGRSLRSCFIRRIGPRPLPCGIAA